MASYPLYNPGPYPQGPNQQAYQQAPNPQAYQQQYQQPMMYAQSYPVVPANQPAQQTQQGGIQVIPSMVTCREEAVATPVDFNAQKIYVFIDPANQRIYTKQFDSNSGRMRTSSATRPISV